MLSPTDISIDVLAMALWWIAIYRSIVSILINNISLRQKTYLFLFVVVGCIFSFQTTTQLLTGEKGSVTLWDVHNAIVLFIGLTLSTAFYNKKRT